MNRHTNILPNQSFSFVNFVRKDRENRKYLLASIGLCIVQFIIFKLLYPFPDFFSDSYHYIHAAYLHLDISVWPIGYSKFLGAFHAVTHSDTALVSFQYFFMQAATLYFYFTILYFFTTSQWTKNVLFAFFFINPLALYLCNTINSDAIFGAMSLLWLTELIWMIHRPRIYQIFTQAILLFFCFTIRNNAYYYPVISILAFVLSDWNWKIKVSGIILPFLFLIPFIVHTQNEAFKLTGTRQFSLFTGWQLANNALYIYDQIKMDSSSLPTPEARELNRISLDYFNQIDPDGYRESLDTYVGNFFIRRPEAPLKTYFSLHYPYHSTEISIIKDWGRASAIFEPFGRSIIFSHPLAYGQYFVWPNVKRYFLPPLSHLEQYNEGRDDIDNIAKVWFHYPTKKVHCVSHQLQSFLIIYEAFFLLFNLYFCGQLMLYVIKSHYIFVKERYISSYWLSVAFLIVNFGFSVVATTNILRYQIIPMLILLSFGLLISDHLERLSLTKKKQELSFSEVSKNEKLSPKINPEI